MDWLKNNRTLAIGAGVAGGAAVAIVGMVWSALSVSEPPLEKAGDGGLSIQLVEPPKAKLAASSPLDVGLSEAAQAMAKGRQALFAPPRPSQPIPVAERPRPAPRPVEVADNAFRGPNPAENEWRREAERRDRIEDERRRQWEEDEALAREERAAWEREMRERRRWEERRYEERRYAPPPPEDEPWPEPPR